MRIIAASVLLVLLAAVPAHARPGDLDRSFGNGGRSAFRVLGGSGGNYGLALLDGRRPVLSVGAYRDTGAFAALSLRLTAAGRVASRTVFAGPARGATRFANGYALTELVSEGVPHVFSLARIGSGTGVTLTVSTPDFTLEDFGVDGSRRAVLLGSVFSGTGVTTGVAARFLPSGAADTGYGEGGVARVGESPTRLLVKRDGRAFAGHTEGRIIALDGAGRPVRGFTPDALIRRGRYLDLDALISGPNGTLLAAGYLNGGFVARLRANGRLDRHFADEGRLHGSALRGTAVNAITRDRRGRLVVVGSRRNAHVLRLTARGRVDRSFGTRGMKTFRLGRVAGVRIESSSARHVAVDDRGRIVVAGESYDDEYELREDQGNPYPAIARLKG